VCLSFPDILAKRRERRNKNARDASKNAKERRNKTAREK